MNNWYKKANNMIFTPQEYIDLKSDSLPYTTKWGFVIKEIHGTCPTCNGELTEEKRLINEYNHFVIIRSVGICYPCKMIISGSPIKITDENEFFVLKNNQWLQTNDSMITKILKWFQK